MDRINNLLKNVNGNWKIGNINRMIDLARNLESELAKARKLLDETLLVWNHDRSLTGDTHKMISEFLYRPRRGDGR